MKRLVNWWGALLVVLILVTRSTSTNTTGHWQHACPYNTFCTTNDPLLPNNLGGSRTPCCTPCSCDDHCWVFNNCCPDVVHNRSVDVQHATCSTLHVHSEYADSVLNGDNSYRVIDFCPSDYDVIDKSVVDKCEGKTSGDREFDDVVAVSDAKNRIYRNKHCAFCHGVRTFDRWRLQLTMCKDKFHEKHGSIAASEFKKRAFDECLLESVPASDRLSVDADRLACGAQVRSTCPSIDGRGITPDVLHGCLNGPEMIYRRVSSRGRLALYKNVMCYLCQADTVQNVCSTNALVSGRLNSFNNNLVMNLDFGVKVEEKTRPDPCGETELYDSNKKTCLKLSCPPYHVVSHGRCLPMGNLLDGYGVTIRTQYEPLEMIQLVDGEDLAYDGKATRKYINPLLAKYGLAECNIMKCYVRVFSAKANDTVVFVHLDAMISFSQECTLDDVARAMRKRFPNNDTVTMAIGKGEFEFIERIIFFAESELQLEFATNTAFWLRERPLMSKSSTTVNFGRSFFLCPFFAFSLQEYNAISTNIFGNDENPTEITEITRLGDGFYALFPDRIVVCFDTYFDLYNNNNNSGGHAGISDYLLVVILLVNILYHV